MGEDDDHCYSTQPKTCTTEPYLIDSTLEQMAQGKMANRKLNFVPGLAYFRSHIQPSVDIHQELNRRRDVRIKTKFVPFSKATQPTIEARREHYMQ